MKPEPKTKLGKRNKATSKKLTVTSCGKIVTLLFLWPVCSNLEARFPMHGL